jgi:broad specificity phosphatase PhoE
MPLKNLIDNDSNRQFKFEGGESWDEVQSRVRQLIQILLNHFVD